MKILLFFISRPSVKLSQTQLRQRTKISKATLVNWARLLVRNNFLLEERIGATKLYSLNSKSPVVRQLKILNTLMQLNVAQIKKKFQCEIYLYGSAARGEDVEESDIDLLVIGKLKKEQIISEIDKISNRIGRIVKVQIFNQVEWSMLASKDPAFYERVEKDKIEL